MYRYKNCQCFQILALCGFLCLFSSCKKEDPIPNTAIDNYNTLWKILDEKYCFFTYKNINWDSLYGVYLPKVKSARSDAQLFYVFGDLLSQLKDGHVNLYSAFDVARYTQWYSDYPDNFSQDLLDKYYLKKNYKIAAGLKYTILDRNVGYIRYSSFSSGIGNGNISAVLSYFKNCKGLILDIRNNGGGELVNGQLLASRFTEEKVLCGYMLYKIGKGHDAFSEPNPIYLQAYSGQKWTKKVVVLTNRSCYSAANDFVNMMRYLPNVTLVGDKTGGGGGLPFSAELPCGWLLRFSASPTLDVQKKHIEGGIEPDIRVDLKESEIAQGRDAIIEEGKRLIKL
ncbi:MAG: S41 family peptidase [Bacteroidales bacterium]